MSEQSFKIGQRVQDVRNGIVGLVIHTHETGVVRVRWPSGDESAYAQGPAVKWLREVAYDLAQLRREGS